MMYPKPYDYGLRLRGIEEYKLFLTLLKIEVGSGSRFMDGLAKEAITMIKKRTMKGISVEGKSFKGLSPTYSEKKGSKRRDLSTGRDPEKGMLGAISSIEYRKGPAFKIIIYVKKVLEKWGYGPPNNKYIIAEVHNYGMISGRKRKGRFKMPRAYFFGLNRKERETLKRYQFHNFMRFMEKIKNYLNK